MNLIASLYIVVFECNFARCSGAITSAVQLLSQYTNSGEPFCNKYITTVSDLSRINHPFSLLENFSEAIEDGEYLRSCFSSTDSMIDNSLEL